MGGLSLQVGSGYRGVCIELGSRIWVGIGLSPL